MIRMHAKHLHLPFFQEYNYMNNKTPFLCIASCAIQNAPCHRTAYSHYLMGKQVDAQSSSDGARKGTFFSWTSICGNGCAEHHRLRDEAPWRRTGNVCSWKKPPRGCCCLARRQRDMCTHLSYTDPRTGCASLISKCWRGKSMNSSLGEAH